MATVVFISILLGILCCLFAFMCVFLLCKRKETKKPDPESCTEENEQKMPNRAADLYAVGNGDFDSPIYCDKTTLGKDNPSYPDRPIIVENSRSSSPVQSLKSDSCSNVTSNDKLDSGNGSGATDVKKVSPKPGSQDEDIDAPDLPTETKDNAFHTEDKDYCDNRNHQALRDSVSVCSDSLSPIYVKAYDSASHQNQDTTESEVEPKYDNALGYSQSMAIEMSNRQNADDGTSSVQNVNIEPSNGTIASQSNGQISVGPPKPLIASDIFYALEQNAVGNRSNQTNSYLEVISDSIQDTQIYYNGTDKKLENIMGNVHAEQLSRGSDFIDPYDKISDQGRQSSLYSKAVEVPSLRDMGKENKVSTNDGRGLNNKEDSFYLKPRLVQNDDRQSYPTEQHQRRNSNGADYIVIIDEPTASMETQVDSGYLRPSDCKKPILPQVFPSHEGNDCKDCIGQCPLADIPSESNVIGEASTSDTLYNDLNERDIEPISTTEGQYMPVDEILVEQTQDDPYVEVQDPQTDIQEGGYIVVDDVHSAVTNETDKHYLEVTGDQGGCMQKDTDYSVLDDSDECNAVIEDHYVKVDGETTEGQEDHNGKYTVVVGTLSKTEVISEQNQHEGKYVEVVVSPIEDRESKVMPYTEVDASFKRVEPSQCSVYSKPAPPPRNDMCDERSHQKKQS